MVVYGKGEIGVTRRAEDSQFFQIFGVAEVTLKGAIR